ncbi:hypothetical protein VTN00DRAFT_10206 [Thermoascus crustaceus]|uniref:uncharacterized protein n=1 Tax=Thermoascus crustaceus TaxID=5088 RepID=UPI003742E0A8
MSFCRAVHPPVTSSPVLFRFVTKPSSGKCGHALRSFSSYGHVYASSKRDMQTATAYRPYTFPDSFPPPRNSGIPDTSIAGGKPVTSENRAPQSSGQSVPPENNHSDLQSSASVREGEAQNAKPVAPTSSQQKTTKPRRTTKLRPRKAAMSITPAAIEQLRTLLSQPDPKLIRVGVKNRGCSGLSYHLEYVEKPGTFDEIVEQDGVKVLIDSKALFSIIGSEMDWQEDKLSRRFVFRNPNIKEQCGCGESFMV